MRVVRRVIPGARIRMTPVALPENRWNGPTLAQANGRVKEGGGKWQREGAAGRGQLADCRKLIRDNAMIEDAVSSRKGGKAVQVRSLGSRASRSVARRLKPRTANMICQTGDRGDVRAHQEKSRPVATISPRRRRGCTPRPRNDRAASTRIAFAMYSVEYTMSVGRKFGKRCRSSDRPRLCAHGPSRLDVVHLAERQDRRATMRVNAGWPHTTASVVLRTPGRGRSPPRWPATDRETPAGSPGRGYYTVDKAAHVSRDDSEEQAKGQRDPHRDRPTTRATRVPKDDPAQMSRPNSSDPGETGRRARSLAARS